MKLLSEAIEEKKFDIRMIRKNLDRTVITSNELKAAESSLPDDAANCEKVSLDAIYDDLKNIKRGSHFISMNNGSGNKVPR